MTLADVQIFVFLSFSIAFQTSMLTQGEMIDLSQFLVNFVTYPS